jgi:hypothetical protein
MGSFGGRALVCAYWLLSFTILGGLLASLRIQTDDLTQPQFTILLGLAIGIMPQVALFALVVTPVVMRGRLKTYSFTKALIIMEACAVVSIIMLAVALIGLMHYRENLLHAPSH